MTSLPSLTSLRLLVNAGLDNNLSNAAARMGMTQSAASRRIAALEAELGTPLLERHRRGVRLTAQGRRLVDEVAPAIARIGRAVQGVKAQGASSPLRLSVYSTFAARWLLPRLPDFQARHPEVEIRLDTAVRPVNFDGDAADLAISYGEGRWPDAEATLLFADEIEPVCSPDFAARHGLARGRAIPIAVRLLESRYLKADWADWGRATATALDGLARTRFPSSLLAYQAAGEGLGLAIAQTALVRAELGRGALVAPFAAPVHRAAGYYLVGSPRSESRKARCFTSWIVGQVRGA